MSLASLVSGTLTDAEAALRALTDSIANAANLARRVAEQAEADKPRPPPVDPVWPEPLPPSQTNIPWLDRLRSEIRAVEAALRPLLRQAEQARRPGEVLATQGGREPGPHIIIGAGEARTLLRAAMPVPMHLHKRGAHAELVAAMAVFSAALLDLNVAHAGPAGIAAANDLIAALRGWVSVMRWHQATAAAGVSWPAPERAPAARARASPDQPGLFDHAVLRPPEAPARASRRGRPAAPRVAGQGTLLLPLPGKPPARRRHAGPSEPADAPPAGPASAPGRRLRGVPVPFGFEVVAGEVVPDPRQQAIMAFIIEKRREGVPVAAIHAGLAGAVSVAQIYRVLRAAAGAAAAIDPAGDQGDGRAARAG